MCDARDHEVSGRPIQVGDPVTVLTEFHPRGPHVGDVESIETLSNAWRDRMIRIRLRTSLSPGGHRELVIKSEVTEHFSWVRGDDEAAADVLRARQVLRALAG